MYGILVALAILIHMSMVAGVCEDIGEQRKRRSATMVNLFQSLSDRVINLEKKVCTLVACPSRMQSSMQNSMSVCTEECMY